MDIQKDANLVRNIHSILNYYDKHLLAISLKNNMECKYQAEKILGLIDKKISIIHRYNNILEKVAKFTDKEKMLFYVYYIERANAIVACGTLNISERTLIRRLKRLKEKYYKGENHGDIKQTIDRER